MPLEATIKDQGTNQPPTMGEVNSIISRSMNITDPNKKQRVKKTITFTQFDAEGVQYPHNDAMTITFYIIVCFLIMEV